MELPWIVGKQFCVVLCYLSPFSKYTWHPHCNIFMTIKWPNNKQTIVNEYVTKFRNFNTKWVDLIQTCHCMAVHSDSIVTFPPHKQGSRIKCQKEVNNYLRKTIHIAIIQQIMHFNSCPMWGKTPATIFLTTQLQMSNVKSFTSKCFVNLAIGPFILVTYL